MAVQVYNGLTPVLNGMAGRFRNTQRMMAIVGAELRAALQQHWRTSGKSIYVRIARACGIQEITPTSATVVVGGGEGMILLHRINGGVVRAKESGALAIPLTAQARKQYARHFPRPLVMIQRPNKPPLLVEVKKKKWTIHYVLVKSVYHRPDPNALPNKRAVEQRIASRIVAEANAILQQKLSANLRLT